MSRNAFTLRLPPEEREALESLSQIDGRPMNHLVTEAVKSYLAVRGQRERDLELSLARLRAYRRRDPGLSNVVARFVEGEVAGADPLEGSAFEEDSAGDSLRSGAAESKHFSGPVQSMMREHLNA